MSTTVTRPGFKSLSLNNVAALGLNVGSDYLTNYLSGSFDNSDIGLVFGSTISSMINSTTNTLSNNLAKGSALFLNLGNNIGSSLAGTGVGLASGYLGKGITAAMGDSSVGKGIGAGVGSFLGGVGGRVVSNLFNGEKAFAGLGQMTKATSTALEDAKKAKDVAKIADIAGKAKFTNFANWGGLAASAVGTGLSAAFGPSKTYNGEYGTGALIADTAYDAAQTVAGFFGPIGSLVSGAMALNKGLTNAFGSTDGMTLLDTIVGNSWTGLLTGGIPFLNWINMSGAQTTSPFKNQSWQNTERTTAFMLDAFGDLPERFNKARKEAGKTYGLFSRSAYNEAQNNIKFANNAWNKILKMTDLNEVLNIRSQYMTSINNQRYAQDIQGGWNPIYRGKQGMKIFNNATNHKIGMRLLSGAALVDSKQMILCSAVG